jgi:hypothetical protein
MWLSQSSRARRWIFQELQLIKECKWISLSNNGSTILQCALIADRSQMQLRLFHFG